MFSKTRKFLFLLVILALTATAVSACSTSNPDDAHLAMMPLDQMPMEVQSAPVAVQEAYQFNTANPDIMQDIPCYCGCGDIGHTSNYDCYVSNIDDKNNITFDNHALGCSICVDITQDTMRLLREGRTVPEIRAYVDATYARYGPSNMP